VDDRDVELRNGTYELFVDLGRAPTAIAASPRVAE